ncbi:MAG: gliding motility-associated C-terminal domain-containing protein [Fluviicola sp.]|nr:gliding motility-associated C-terminal domain-containing protein [Fluviicola sp.]
MKKILLGIIGITFIGQFANSQCTVSAIATPSPIVCGESVILSAYGSSTGSLVLDEDFNTGGFGPGWSSTPGAVSFANPCSPAGVDGTPHAWMDNNTSVPRALISAPYDLSTATAGVTVCFDMLFATQGNAAPCEGPDEPDEGVYLQYSTDGGVTWVTINYFDPNGGNDPQLTTWNNYCFPLPPAAITNNTMIQWFQSADSGADYDHWGIDNVQIFMNDLNSEVVWLHDGYSYGVGSGGGDNPTPVTPTVTTTYTSQITTGTGQVCTQDVTVVVTSPVFDVNMTAAPAIVCVGNCATISGTAQIIQDPGGIETYENNEFDIVTGGSASVNINVQGINTNTITTGLIQNITINGFDFSGTFVCTNFGGCPCGTGSVGFGSTCSLDPSSFTVTLTAPGGCTIILAPAGVANGNYSNTVFVPVGGTAFNGTFPSGGVWDPQDPMTNFNGCNPNGVWTLSFDAPGIGIGIGTLFGWSITFDDPPIYQPVCTTWSPTAGLTSPSTLVTDACPATSTDYVLTVGNCTPGCPTYTQTFTIIVDPCVCTPPNLIITPLQACSPLTVDLSTAIGAGSDPATLTYYATQLDAQNGTNPITTTVSVSGSYWVRAEDPTDPLCFLEYEIIVTISTLTYSASVVDENCGAGDGQINLTPNPAGTYTYSIDGGTTSQAGGSFTGLVANTYNVIITDPATGCTVTGTETVANLGGPAITSVVPTNPTCNGVCDGTITVTATGGTLPYTYTWYDGIGTIVGTNSATITGLCAGNYSVDVSDATGGSTQLFFDDFESGAAGWNLNSVQGAQGADPNFFQVNDTEGGVAAGGCGIGGNGDATLHITSVFNPAGGAAYDAGGLCGFLFCPQTNVQAESPLINTVGQTGLTLNFDFIAGGAPPTDQASVWYNCGAGWTLLSTLFSGTAGCTGQGLWTAFSAPLPPLCDGITNLQVAIRWENNDDGAGSDPSVAINNIEVVTSAGASCVVNQPTALVDPPIIDPTFILTDFCAGLPNSATGIVTPGGTFTFNPVPTDGAAINTATGEITNGVIGATYSVEYTTAAPCSASLILTVNVNGVSYTAVVVDESCGAGDGSITLTAAPAGTYTYSIDGGTTSQAGGSFTTLTANTYNVIITDPVTGCTATGTETVANLGGATIDLVTPVDASCNAVCDGSITVTASGGVGPLNHQWLDNLGNPIGTNANSINSLCAGSYTIEVTNNDGSCLVTAPAVILEPAVVDPTFVLTDFCAGSANAATGIVTAGGTFAFNPLPGDGATINTATGEITNGVIGATYSVEYTTAAPCSASLILTVNVNGLTYTAVVVDESCGLGDGSITLTATPAGTYTYSIDGGTTSQAGGIFTTLTANTYNVIITDLATGCTVIGTEAVANVGGATIDLVTPVDASCNAVCDGSITVTASGGVGPLNYQWLDNLGNPIGTNANSINSLCAGNYTIEVTNNDGSCLVTAPAVILEPAVVDPTFVLTDFCAGSANAATGIVTIGGTFAFNPVPTDGATINTATGEITNGVAGTQYSVEYTTAAPCSASLILTVNVNALPVPVITGALSYCLGGNSTLDAGAGYTIYNWSTGDATQTITVLAQIGITVTVTDANGCVGTSAPVDVIESTSIITNNIITICQGGSAVIHGNTETVAAIYSQTFISVSGCDSIANVDLIVNPIPTPVITGPLSYCQGGDVTLDAGGPFISYSWNIGGTNQTLTTTSGTGISVTVEDANNCFGTSPTVDVVELLPVVTNSTMTICQGGSALIFGNNETVATVYTQINVGQNGCDSTSNVTLVVNPLPTPVITGPLTYCQGANVTLDAGGPFISYSWNIGGTNQTLTTTSGTGISVTVEDANNCFGTSPTVDVVELLPVVTNSTMTICQGASALIFGNNETVAAVYTQINVGQNGCDSTSNVTLVVNTLPTPVITGPLSYCQGADVTLDAGGPFISYSWNIGGTNQTLTTTSGTGISVTVEDANNCFGTSPTVDVLELLPVVTNSTMTICQGASALIFGNNETVAAVYTQINVGQNGCDSTSNVTLVVDNNPVIDVLNFTEESCLGDDDGTIDVVSVINGSGTYTYSWDIVPDPATANVNSLSPGTYTVTVTDANTTCQTTATTTLNAAAICCDVVIDTTGTTAPSCGQATGIIDAIATGGDGNYMYSINGGPFVASGTFNGLVAGNYQIVVQDGSGVCNDLIDVVLVDLLAPTITSVAATDLNCNNDNSGAITIVANGGNGVLTYGISDGVNVTTNATGIFTGLPAGNYTVVVTDANGCFVNDVAVLIEPTPVTVSAIVTNVNCFGDATGEIVVTGGGGTPNYTFSIDNGTTWLTSATFSGLLAQNYDVMVQDANNCQSLASVENITEPTQLGVVVNATDEQCFAACDGELTWAGSGGTAPYSFSYNGQNGNASPIFNLCASNYNYVITDDLGCTVNGSATINPGIEIIPGVVSIVDDGCDENCSGEISITSNTGVSYQITGMTSPTGDFVGVCAGSYSITIFDANGCFTMATAQVGTMPVTEANFTFSPGIITTLENEITFTNASTNADVYNWTITGPNGYNESFSSENLTHLFPLDTGTYTICLTAINSTGCTDVICRSLIVRDAEVLYVPNTFTPDGDEFNQTFRAYAMGIDIYDYEMLIFNRWGEIIWESHDVLVGWDGTYKGKVVQVGTYTWKITFKDFYDDDRKIYHGHVNIVR